MPVRRYTGLSCRMHDKAKWIGLYIFYAVLPCALTIDCYHCTSLNGDNKACEDTFKTDISTVHLISRSCYYGYWRAHFCVKLDGVREDGTTIIVRQCTMKDWGSHCGLIQFEVGNRLEDIEGCLETCNFDGCNPATKINYSFSSLCLTLSLYIFVFAVR